MNSATIILALIIFSVFAMIIVKLFRDRRRGRHLCSCGACGGCNACSGCGSRGGCGSCAAGAGPKQHSGQILP